MTNGGLPPDRLNRILVAVETIEESLGILARKQRIGREEYKSALETRDIVERRFVKMTEAAIDIAEELVKHERGQPPASNPESMRALGEIDVLSGPLIEEMAEGADSGTSWLIPRGASLITTMFTTHSKTSTAIAPSCRQFEIISIPLVHSMTETNQQHGNSLANEGLESSVCTKVIGD